MKSINPYTRSLYANSIALHDFERKIINVKAMIEYISNLFIQYGVTPTRMGITSPLNKSKKMNSYQHELKKLQSIPDEEIVAIQLDAIADDGATKLFYFLYDRDDHGTCVLTLDSQLFSHNEEKWIGIANAMIHFIAPHYAYTYQREFKKGPHCYPWGVICGIPFNDPEEEKIDQWGKKYRYQEYQTGDLRDIYPMNLITDVHLDRTVSAHTTLGEFIASDPIHGRLEPLSDGRFAWWVMDEHIEQVREALRPSGMIIAG